jgi:hypothetical protein
VEGGVPTVCPRRPALVLYRRDDPTVFIFTGCDSFKCSTCGPKKTNASVAAVAWELARHDWARFITLSLAPLDWERRRKQVADLRSRLRAKGYDMEWSWATERGHKTGMVHIHLAAWGSYVPQRVLQELWGDRIVFIEAVHRDPESVGKYMAKETRRVAQYMTKEQGEDYEAALALNHGRPLHYSKGFFQGLTLRQAISNAKAARNGGEAVEWMALDGEDAERVRQALGQPKAARDALMLALTSRGSHDAA